MLKPKLQHRLVAGEREIAHLLGQRDRLAADHVFGDRARRVNPPRPAGGVSRLTLDEGPAARKRPIGKLWLWRRFERQRHVPNPPLPPPPPPAPAVPARFPHLRPPLHLLTLCLCLLSTIRRGPDSSGDNSKITAH